MPELTRPLPPADDTDRSRLLAIIEPIVVAHGGEVVDFELKSEQNGWVLRIYVEKLGSGEKKLSTADAAVDLELCANVARELSPALDVADVVPHAYNLEISSPGVERPLRGEKDFVRFAGEKAKLKLSRAHASGQKVLVGILGPVQGDTLTIKDGGRSFDVPLADIASARLVFEFGPAPKPGKKKSSKG